MSQPILTVMREGVTIKTCPIAGELLLGRSEDCQIHLDDRSISRHHAVFRMTGQSIQVEKKSEFAPLNVNGVDCASAILKENDIITIGPYFIRIGLPSVAVVPPPTVAIPAAPTENEGPALDAMADILDPVIESGAAEDPALNLLEPAAPDIAAESGENGMAADDFAIQPGDGVEENPALEVPEAEVAEIAEIIDEDGKTKFTPAAKISVKLIFKPGTANVEQFEINQNEVMIGRGKNCDIILNDKKASRKNSIIKRVGLNFIIQDLESANGTYVNGNKVQEAELSGEDLIRVGSVEFQFKAQSVDYANQEKDFMSLPPEVEEANYGQPDSAPLEGVPPADPFLPVEAAAALGTENNGMAATPPGLAGDLGLPSAALGAAGSMPGITGLDPAASSQKKTLVDRFKVLPRRTQILVVIVALGVGYWIMDEDVAVKKTPPKKAAPVADKGPVTFESLPQEKKRFIEAQHALAFDLYKNKEYDKAIFEIEKIFTIIPNYKDSQEILRYAKEGKRRLEALEEEQKKKEEEAKLKAKVAALVDEARQRMSKKEYEQAKEIFGQILFLDPDNLLVANWQKEISTAEEMAKTLEQQKQVQVEINQHAWALYKEAAQLKKEGKYHGAIATFQKSIDIGASDPKLAPLAKNMMVICRNTIRRLRDPVLARAKKKEAAGEFSEAFALFRKASRIDPPHPAAYAGMGRIKGILHDRAKAIYTEAILAESFSDFSNAKRLFADCLKMAPPDDIYHDRAQRKLSHYFRKDEGGAQ